MMVIDNSKAEKKCLGKQIDILQFMIIDITQHGSAMRLFRYQMLLKNVLAEKKITKKQSLYSNQVQEK